MVLGEDEETKIFDAWFVKWVRAAFRAKGNAAAIHDLIDWSDEISKTGRETQKHFLHYCIEVFRQALLTNYQAKSLVFMIPTYDDFKFDKFAPFVNHSNIEEIYQQISEAIYHIERNGNAKLILTDLSIRLTRLIHKK
jgi:DNA polymerase-3 subunit delta'